MGFWGILAVTVTIAILLTLILAYFYPRPILRRLGDYLTGGAVYAPTTAATVTGNVTLYRANVDQPAAALMVVFLGGCGFYCEPAHNYSFLNALHAEIGTDCDLMTFVYPTRFEYTIPQTMLAINEVLRPFLSYGTIHAVGISFGALLAGAFMQKERSASAASQMQIPAIGMRFATLTTIGGLFESQLDVPLLTGILRHMVLRHTPGLEHYTCYGLLGVPKLVISSAGDFMSPLSAKFIRTERCQAKMFSSSAATHGFFRYVNMEEARETIQLMAEFIRKNQRPAVPAIAVVGDG
jgi:hypothetical protein